ncbi:MAG TPA: hypothetical protein PLQ56_18820 [Aggregatilineales bacterium]|nr:hypothetical protein [Aggregatilineales bacterium]
MTDDSQSGGPANPFASLTGNGPSQPAASRLPGAAPAQPPPTPPKPSLLKGPAPLKWRIMPVMPKLVRFELHGLGDPFYRLLNRPLHTEFPQAEALYKAFQERPQDTAALAEQLDQAWSGYEIQGAVLLYRWNPNLRFVLNGRIPGGNSANGEDKPESYDDDNRQPAHVLRALDMALVLNVLARSRVNVLLHNAPLAFEPQYLRQVVFTDDPRLVRLAQSTGWLEETVLL